MIKEVQRREKQGKQARKVYNSLVVAKKIVRRELERKPWTKFILAWSTNVVRSLGDRFHQNFQVGLRVHPLGYRDVNLGYMINIHKQAITNKGLDASIRAYCNTLATTSNN